MKFLGNILWLIFGGIIIAIIYYMVGLLMCISIIGIPFGVYRLSKVVMVTPRALHGSARAGRLTK